MVVFILCGAFLLLGVLINDENVDAAAFLGAIGLVGLIFWGGVVGFSWVDNLATIADYKKDMAYLQSVSKNRQLSEQERKDAVKLADNYNSEIQHAILFKDSVWIGVLYSSKVAALQSVDYNKIPPSNVSSQYQVAVKSDDSD